LIDRSEQLQDEILVGCGVFGVLGSGLVGAGITTWYLSGSKLQYVEKVGGHCTKMQNTVLKIQNHLNKFLTYSNYETHVQYFVKDCADILNEVAQAQETLTNAHVFQ